MTLDIVSVLMMPFQQPPSKPCTGHMITGWLLILVSDSVCVSIFHISLKADTDKTDHEIQLVMLFLT